MTFFFFGMGSITPPLCICLMCTLTYLNISKYWSTTTYNTYDILLRWRGGHSDGCVIDRVEEFFLENLNQTSHAFRPQTRADDRLIPTRVARSTPTWVSLLLRLHIAHMVIQGTYRYKHTHVGYRYGPPRWGYHIHSYPCLIEHRTLYRTLYK